jgi:hypothetical protein
MDARSLHMLTKLRLELRLIPVFWGTYYPIHCNFNENILCTQTKRDSIQIVQHSVIHHLNEMQGHTKNDRHHQKVF